MEVFFFEPIVEARDRAPTICRTEGGGLQIEYSYLVMMGGDEDGYLRIEPDGSVDKGRVPLVPCR